MENIIRVKSGESIREAQLKAREIENATIIVEKGVYREALEFDERDSGATYIGEGAVLTGGLEVPYSETKDIPEEIKARLTPEAAEKVRCIDLKAYGFTKDDWGEVYPIGSYCTAHKYTDGKTGVNLEVFSGGKRMKIARYPNDGYLKIDAVMDVGDCWEFPSRNYFWDWRERVDHRGGIYIVDDDTAERISGWKDPSTAWIFGYFMHDWADASTPLLKIETKNRLIYPKYVAYYGCKKGADYYFYNVLEELDAPGEYYLDRESGILYFYTYEENDTIEISLSDKPVIKIDGAENITIQEFTAKCCKSNGITVKGNNCLIKGCTVMNVAEYGITVSGYGNTVDGCEVTRTGKGGISVVGGDRETLTPGNNLVINNYIHHFSEVYQTYQPGVGIEGVGNRCAHNEICFTPHTAILYGGNDILIEYNNIHDVVQYSEDAGAIYAGKNWTYHGCVIRYNIIRDVGSKKLPPVGIYWDDGLSGQTAYGNILINVYDCAFGIGGGRDIHVYNNVIINAGRTSISYDDRNRDGFVYGGSFKDATIRQDSIHWVRLREVPYQNELWAKKYPTLADVITDFTQYDDPRFPVNPTNALVERNIAIREGGDKFDIAESVYTYGKIGVNPIFNSCEEANFDIETLRFTVLPENFEEIPVEKIGRNKGD